MCTAYIGKIEFTPLGNIWVAMTERGILSLEIQGNRETLTQQLKKRGFTQVIEDPQRLSEAFHQISDYLNGKRKSFTLPVDWSGMTKFQEEALRATSNIPYGKITTYGEIARQIGKPRASRAVGRAEATNPIPLVIPCHRVIGTDGKLHGYGAPGGVETKAWLLWLEGGA